jgi:protein-S-isoprenylcysteine O-methyltransferase Ste14
MHVLGRFYTRTLQVVPGHRIIVLGPYSRIRHPGYLGSILVWSGASLGLGNWIAFIMTILLLILAYVHRIKSEETMLSNALGDEYEQYVSRTRRLLPFVY